METAELLSLVEHMEDNIDDLEENLEPLLAAALSATTKKLPVLDKAKLYVLIVYSIESLLFSYLRLNGVQAKEHPVFKELTRVKQYFEKIKVVETGPTKPRGNISLNKQAAGRVIKHALAGNDKYDLERAEREAREKLIAKRKLQNSIQKKLPQEQPHNVDGARQDVEAQEDSESESSSEDEDQEDAVMADVSADSGAAMVDAPNESAGKNGGIFRRQDDGDMTQRKHKGRQAGKRAKKKSGGQRASAPQTSKPRNG